MKNLLVSILLLTSFSCFASKPDSTSQRHIISVSMANGISQEFFGAPDHHPTTHWTIGNGIPIAGAVAYGYYTPMYSVHVQLHYSLGLSRVVRIETGIGYMINGLVNTEGYPTTGGFHEYYKIYTYQGCITLPLYVKFIKPTHHGAFTCTLGPDFTLPVHDFYQNKDIALPPAYNIPTNGHRAYTASRTSATSSMGLYLKMAWEKQIKSNLSINIGPVIDFYELVPFHTYGDSYAANGYYPYQFYAGLDVAVNFGLKKKNRGTTK